MHYSKARLSDGSLLLAVMIWGLNFPVLKAALSVMHPNVINTFRFSISTLVLGLIYAVRLRSSGESFWQPVRTHGLRLALLGLVGTVFYQVLFIIGVNATAAGTAALIMASAPIWTAVFGVVYGTERLKPAAWGALGISLVGTAIVVAGGSSAISLAPGTLFGNLMMVAAALFWGLYTALNRKVVQEVDPVGVSFFNLLVGLPVLIAIGIPFFGGVAWSEVDTWVWLAILYSGGLSTGLAIVIWNVGIRTVGPSHTAAYNNLVPFAALIASFLILSEPITLLQLGGGAFIIGGLVLMRRTREPVQATARWINE